MRAIALLALSTALLWSAPGLAEASSQAENARTAHERADRNDDGNVDPREYALRMVDVFYFADANHDGYVVVAEYAATNIGSFETSDLNGDGKVTLPEFLDATIIVFRTADVDDDSRLSAEEVVGYGRGVASGKED